MRYRERQQPLSLRLRNSPFFIAYLGYVFLVILLNGGTAWLFVGAVVVVLVSHLPVRAWVQNFGDAVVSVYIALRAPRR